MHAAWTGDVGGAENSGLGGFADCGGRVGGRGCGKKLLELLIAPRWRRSKLYSWTVQMRRRRWQRTRTPDASAQKCGLRRVDKSGSSLKRRPVSPPTRWAAMRGGWALSLATVTVSGPGAARLLFKLLAHVGGHGFVPLVSLTFADACRNPLFQIWRPPPMYAGYRRWPYPNACRRNCCGSSEGNPCLCARTLGRRGPCCTLPLF